MTSSEIYSVDDVIDDASSSPSCEEFIPQELTELFRPRDNITEAERSHLAVKSVINGFIVPVVCVFGIVGNALNLVVLTRKRVQHSMDDLERSVHVGFVALAVSDLSFCLLDLASRFLPEKYMYFGPRDSILGLYLKTYKGALLNVFMLVSTWLTVVMALGRYLAVCRPLHARGTISLKATRLTVLGVFVASLLVNAPRFFHYEVFRTRCDELVNVTRLRVPDACRCVIYHQETSELFRRIPAYFVFWYGIVWSVVAILVPLAVLCYCNASLVLALRRSYDVQRLARVTGPRDSGHRITPTLVALVLMFVVLVGPSGVLDLFRNYVLRGPPDASGSLQYYRFVTAADVTNLLVLANFAVNFVLYCVVNVHFRRAAADVVCCLLGVPCRRSKRRGAKQRFSSSIRLTHYIGKNAVGAAGGTTCASEVETEL